MERGGRPPPMTTWHHLALRMVVPAGRLTQQRPGNDPTRGSPCGGRDARGIHTLTRTHLVVWEPKVSSGKAVLHLWLPIYVCNSSSKRLIDFLEV